MANFMTNYAQSTWTGVTLAPQVITGNTNGSSVLVGPSGSSGLSAALYVGAVSALTSLDVKLQSSPDGSNWTDITGATFTTVTAANASQIIDFQMPTSTTLTAALPNRVRAVATLVGTNANLVVILLGATDYTGTASFETGTSTTIN